MALSFHELQGQLQASWGREMAEGCGELDLLMVPSLTMDPAQLELVTGAHHYEERQLFSLMRLRDPAVQVVYVTSKLLPELVVDAVLELMPGVPTSHARRRLHLFDTDDGSSRPLTEKLLERPALLGRIRERLRPGRSFISCYVVTDLEKALSERLQVPLLGTDPALGYWGTKAGSRELFARCGVPHPPGTALAHSLEDLAEAIGDLWETHPDLETCVVKLNEGFSGEGNARLAFGPLQLVGLARKDRVGRLRDALDSLPMPAAGWKGLVNRQGALAEAWLEGGEAIRSPSVQGMIHPGGEVEVLSTHEQILGGAGGQTYLGCRFPADAPYRVRLMGHGLAVGQALAAEGALERFGVDFIARRFDEHWDLQAVEINLRQGGTTHPFMALRAITAGSLDADTGLFLSPTGQPLHYRATDNLSDPRLRGLMPIDLVDIVAEAGLHYDPARLQGSVFHLLGCLSEFGKLGMTCIGRDPEQAAAVYRSTVAELLEGAAVRRGDPLPLPDC